MSRRNSTRPRHERRGSRYGDIQEEVPIEVPIAAVTAIAIENYNTELQDWKAGNGKGTVSPISAVSISDDKVKGGRGTVIQENENCNFRAWPRALRAEVIKSFGRTIDEQGAKSYLESFNWPGGLVQSLLKNIAMIPIRFIIVDDSGSMSTNDGHRIVGQTDHKKIISCTRWSELSQVSNE